MNEMQKKKYNEYVEEVTPKTNLICNMIKAFITGGIICVIGQGILNFCLARGMDKDTAGGWCSMLLVLLSVVLTGFNLFSKIVDFGGAGALVPITGFANSVVSPAMEFRSEGFIYGLAAKMFIIAGPIIVFGVASSSLVGLIYYFIYRLF